VAAWLVAVATGRTLAATGATSSTEASPAYEKRATLRTRRAGMVTVGIMLWLVGIIIVLPVYLLCVL
jgi:hypothetical protein